MTHKPLFPKAWNYYAPIVATLGAAVTALNAWLGTAEGKAQSWIALAISTITAALIWLRSRATKVGVTTVQLPETTKGGDASATQ